MSLLKSFFKSTKKIHFGRFDINTTEKQKISKMILANSDNCGDLICGKPKLIMNIIKYGDRHSNAKSFEPYQYSTISINSNIKSPELCCEYFNFSKCNDCFMK